MLVVEWNCVKFIGVDVLDLGEDIKLFILFVRFVDCDMEDIRDNDDVDVVFFGVRVVFDVVVIEILFNSLFNLLMRFLFVLCVINLCCVFVFVVFFGDSGFDSSSFTLFDSFIKLNKFFFVVFVLLLWCVCVVVLFVFIGMF